MNESFHLLIFANIFDFEKHRESQSKRMLMLMSAFHSMESMRISVHCNFYIANEISNYYKNKSIFKTSWNLHIGWLNLAMADIQSEYVLINTKNEFF